MNIGDHVSFQISVLGFLEYIDSKVESQACMVVSKWETIFGVLRKLRAISHSGCTNGI